jgi:CzcA family heavy metal efflux pump
MNLAEFAVNHRVTTMMAFLAAIVVGGVCLWQIPIDLMPELDLPTITVMTVYEGAAPEDVETKVTEILEGSLATVPELDHIMSTSKEDVSIISLSFQWGTDLDTRANEVRDTIGMAKRGLPDDVEEPRVLKFDIARFPIMVYGVTAKESFPVLEKLLEDEVADPLKRLPGVGTAAAMVPLVRQVNVDLDRERLAAYGLTPLDVVYAISRENQDTPGGNIKSGLTDYLIRVPGEFEEAEWMERIVLAARDGSVVRLEDVGTVEDGYKEMSRYITVNGQTGGVVMVQKQSEANTVAVANAVKKRIKQIEKTLPPDVKLLNVMDGSEDITRTIRDLSRTLAIGGLLAMLVVLVFLRQVRATLIIALTMPFSLILAVIVVFFLDNTINMMTLFGLIIAIGMIVDNAIVILENITRHREEGERAREGAIYGAREVAMAVTASTLTTVCIFFPVLFVKGITGIFFSEFAVIVSVVLLASLFSALTLTPMLSSVLLPRGKLEASRQRPLFQLSEGFYNRLSDAYGTLLDQALHHRKTVVFLAALIFGASLFLIPYIGTEFMPEEDRASMSGTVFLPVGTRVEETARVMKELEQVILETIPEDERLAYFTRCGMSESGMSSIMGDEGTHIGSFSIRLVPLTDRDRGVTDIAAIFRQRLKELQGPLRIVKFRLETGDPMSGLLMGGEQPLTINVFGNDLEATDKVAEQIKTIAQNTPGAVDVSVSREQGRPELWVNVDRDKASELGLNVSDVGDAVRAGFYGRQASVYRVRGDEYDVFVRMREPDRDEPDELLDMPLRLPSGQLIRARNIAETAAEFGPVEIDRKDQERLVNVIGNTHGRSLGEVVADIEAEISELDYPQGVEVIMAGQTEEQRESFMWLSLSLVVGMLLVYMVMASQFESLLDPFVVMFSLPFALTGAIWAIFLAGHNLSIVVFLGALLLIGVVVNNAIVLVDYTNILRARGLELFDAVRQAGRTRLRPVLMTALTTIAALIPMAFGKGQGAEIWNPLGLTVLGGLLVSTLVTLVIVPVLYSLFETHVRGSRTS